MTPQAVALAAILGPLLLDWPNISGRQKKALVAQVEKMLASGSMPSTSNLSVDTAEATEAVQQAMASLAAEAAALVVGEAKDQGVDLNPAETADSTLKPVASAVSERLADQLKTVAAEAAELASEPGVPDSDVVSAVEAALDAVTDGMTKTEVGGALHGAMNTARVETLRRGPVGAVYASERNDENTCDPCHEIDGRWLGNTDDLAMVELSYPGGAYGGYVGCLGGVRCRGTIVGVWREGANDLPRPEKATPEPEPVAPVPATEPAIEPTLADHIATGIKSSKVIGNGVMARTELVIFNDGSQAIRKEMFATSAERAVRDVVESADAEELASLFGTDLGINAPAVVRVGPGELYMDYVASGVTGMERYPGGRLRDNADVQALADSAAGRQLGLFDVAIGNIDRIGGNWLIGDGGTLTAIDHGLAFMATGDPEVDLMQITDGSNVFAARLLDVTEDFSHADIARLQQGLATLRPEFERLNRIDWYDAALARLQSLDEQATGDGSVF